MNDHVNRKPFEPLNGESHTTKQDGGDGYVSYSKIQMQIPWKRLVIPELNFKGRDGTCLSICAPDD